MRDNARSQEGVVKKRWLAKKGRVTSSQRNPPGVIRFVSIEQKGNRLSHRQAEREGRKRRVVVSFGQMEPGSGGDGRAQLMSDEGKRWRVRNWNTLFFP